MGLEEYLDKLLIESAYLDLILIHSLGENVANQIVTIRDSYGEIISSEEYGYSIPKRFYLSPNTSYTIEIQDFDGCFPLSSIEFTTGDEKSSVDVTAQYIYDVAYLDLTLSCIPSSTNISLAGVTVTDSFEKVVFSGVFGSESVKRIEVNTSSSYTVSFSNPSGFSLGGEDFSFTTSSTVNKVYTHSDTFYQLYGFKIDEDDADPFTRVHYINDNANFNPVSVDVDGDGSYNAGDWVRFIELLARPCVLNSSGSVAFFLDRINQNLKENGDSFSLSSGQNMMVEFSKLWVRKNDDAKTFEYAFVEFDGSSCWAWANGENTRADYIYYPMYKGSVTSSGNMLSLPFATPTVSTTAQQEIDACALNGVGWYPRTHLMHNFLEEMIWLLGKSTDCQTTFGKGYTASTNTALLDTGSTIETGAFYGSSDATKDVKFLYIEGLWGNRLERITGVLYNVETNSDVYVKAYPPFNLNGDNYELLTDSSPVGSGYATEIKINDKGNVPQKLNGSSSTFYCDYQTYSSTVKLGVPLTGGYWAGPTTSGMNYWHCTSDGTQTTTRGASPHYIPPTTA